MVRPLKSFMWPHKVYVPVIRHDSSLHPENRCNWRAVERKERGRERGEREKERGKEVLNRNEEGSVRIISFAVTIARDKRFVHTVVFNYRILPAGVSSASDQIAEQ